MPGEVALQHRVMHGIADGPYVTIPEGEDLSGRGAIMCFLLERADVGERIAGDAREPAFTDRDDSGHELKFRESRRKRMLAVPRHRWRRTVFPHADPFGCERA